MEFISMPNNISMTAGATEEAAVAAAKSSSVYAVVTPTGDEFELLPHHSQNNDNVSSFDTAAVATVSAATPTTADAAAAAGGNTFPSCQYYPAPSSISTASAAPPSYAASSFQSLAVTPAAASLLMPAYPTNRGDNGSHDYDEATLLMDAAKALCSMKNLGAGCPQQHHGTVVNMAMKMMLSSPSATIAQDGEDCWQQQQQQQQQNNNDILLQEGSLLQYIAADDSSSTASDYVHSNSLTHPDRLAIDDDVDEVNKLHQYVRKELLEIFVVPQISDSDSEDESDDDYDEDYRATKKSRKNNDPPSLPTTRSAAAARKERSSSSSSASSSAMASSISASTNSTQRHYPGRVGFRCVHCADCRRKTASKAAFFPLRLTNIYREVCAWQRIHFKTCPMVPASVRKRYDHYKQVDTSRGKVRYWETSAKKIGLQNNPDRYDGIIFANTAWRG